MDPEDLDNLMKQCLGLAAAQLAERRSSELGLIALKSAELGTGFFFTTVYQNRRQPESKGRAIVIVACGDLPEDLLKSLINHAKGTLQDFTHGNPDIRVSHKEETPDDDD